MINRIILVGRLTKDPEMRYTPNGLAVAQFTLAVNRAFSSNGEKEADFIPCVVWRKQAENVANFLKKGSLAGVEGRIQTRSYDAQDGTKRYVTEVVCDSVQFLEPKGANNGGGNPMMGGGNFQQQQPMGGGFQPTPSQNPVNPYREESERPSFPAPEDPFGKSSNQKVTIAEDDLPF